MMQGMSEFQDTVQAGPEVPGARMVQDTTPAGGPEGDSGVSCSCEESDAPQQPAGNGGGVAPGYPQGPPQGGAYQPPYPYGFQPAGYAAGPVPPPNPAAGGPYTYAAAGPQPVPGAFYSGPAFYHTPPTFAGPAAQPVGWQQTPQAQGPEQVPHDAAHGPAGGPGHLKHDAHKYGQLMQLVNDLANGNADPSRMMDVLGGLDTRFWKGALVGVAATLLLTNDAVKGTIANSLSGILGIFGNEKQEARSES